MAKVYGDSGAWTDVQTSLNWLGLYLEAPDELRALVPQLEQVWTQSEPAALDAFNHTTQELTELVSVKREEHATALAALEAEHTRRIAELNQGLNPEGDISIMRQMQRWLLWGPLRLRRIYLQQRHARRTTSLQQLPLQAEASLKSISTGETCFWSLTASLSGKNLRGQGPPLRVRNTPAPLPKSMSFTI